MWVFFYTAAPGGVNDKPELWFNSPIIYFGALFPFSIPIFFNQIDTHFRTYQKSSDQTKPRQSLNVTSCTHVNLGAKGSTDHVPEVGAEGACGLVVFHNTIIVEDFSTAVTDRDREKNVT